jgi:hypothetical protein
MFDPTSAPRVTQPTARRALDFFRSRGQARYNWYDNCNCACAQFFQTDADALGRDWIPMNDQVRVVEGIDLNLLAFGGDITRAHSQEQVKEITKSHTFDQLAARLEKVLEDETVFA